ncbi:MAG: M23 family metallopeptidase [Acidobacteriota bacterium]
MNKKHCQRLRGLGLLAFMLPSAAASGALAQTAAIADAWVRPKQPLYERVLLNNQLAIDLAFRTQPGSSVTFERGELLYFDEDGSPMGSLEITPGMFLSNLRIFSAAGTREPDSTTIGPGRTAVTMLTVLQFPRKLSPATIRARLFLRGAAQPLEFPEIRPLPYRRNEGNYIFPFGPPTHLRGNWLASGGHGLRRFSHRRSALLNRGAIITLQRYADDYEIWENGARSSGDPAPNESYFGFGEPALAIAAGTVIRAVDGVADNFPVFTVQTQGYGNNLHVDHGNGEISHYVHLKNGSIRVAVGQKVEQGEVIAELGNSGSSTAPHTHWELAMSLERDPNPVGPFHTEGLPMYFSNIRIMGLRQIATAIPAQMPIEIAEAPTWPASPDFAGPGNLAEVEPNNDLASAQAIRLPVRLEGTVGLGEMGDWADAGDVIEDIFLFELDEPGTVLIEVASADDADLDLLLLNSDLRVVADATSDASSERLLEELEAGTYFLFLSQFGDSSSPGPETSYELEAAVLGQELLFAQYGQGEGFSSTLFLLNPSPTERAAALLDLRLSAGEALGKAPRTRVAGGPEPTSEVSLLRIPSKGLLHLPSPAQGQLRLGSARLLSSLALSGSILFGGDSGLAGVAGIQALGDFLVPVEMDAAAGVRTGVALANPSGEPARITLTLRDPAGVPVPGGTLEEVLPPRGQSARFADEIYAPGVLDLSQFRGSLQVTSEIPVAGMVIRSSPGEFATFPVTAVEAGTQLAADGPAARHFPQFASGPGISSQLILVNPSPTLTASVEIHLSAQDGSPLPLGADPAEGIQVSVDPLGSAFVLLPQSQALTVGSARIESDLAMGAAILLDGDFGVAGVAATAAFRNLLLPVENDLSAGVQTGVALANPGTAPVEVTLRLLDPLGEAVPDGIRILELPAGGQLARQVQELFEGIDLADFIGVLEVICEEPVAAAAIRTSPGQFATLPVSEVAPSTTDGS